MRLRSRVLYLADVVRTGGLLIIFLLFCALTVAIDSNVSLKDSLAATIVEVDDGALGLFGATPVAQSTGWGTPTGTATKTTFDTATVTTAQLAERVKALLDYLIARGDIGA